MERIIVAIILFAFLIGYFVVSRIRSRKQEETRTGGLYDTIWDSYFIRYAGDLHPFLVKAVGWNESKYDPNVVSSAGAVGVMQIMKIIARAYGGLRVDAEVDERTNPAKNIMSGCLFLNYLYDKYDGDLSKTLAGYIRGETKFDPSLRQYGVDWFEHQPYKVKRYVPKVISDYGKLQSLTA